MRIFDAVIVTRAEDLPLLEARFAELAELDAVHVIAECMTTLDGTAKPLHFAESDLWSRFRGRWNHVRVEAHEIPSDAPPRERKNALREYLADGVTAEPDDIILHGGIDEIPARWAVAEIAAGEIPLPVALEMRWCAYTPRLVHPKGTWRGTVAQSWRQTGSFSGMREKRMTLPAIINAGTRLSMFGEPVPEDMTHPDGHALWETEIDESFPVYVQARR